MPDCGFRYRIITNIDNGIDYFIVMHLGSASERLLEQLSLPVISFIIHQCKNGSEFVDKQFHVLRRAKLCKQMKVVGHDAARNNPDMILHCRIPENTEEYDEICISVEDNPAVNRDLKDVLIPFFVEFPFDCHSIKF